MDLDRGRAFFAADDPASSHQLESHRGVELRGPINGDFQALSRQQVPVRCEQDPIAAHVEGLADTHIIGALTVENLIADLPLDGEPVCASAIVFVFFQSHNLLPSSAQSLWPCLHTQIAAATGGRQ